MIILRENNSGLYVGQAPRDGDTVKVRKYNGAWEVGECCSINTPFYDIRLQNNCIITIRIISN